MAEPTNNPLSPLAAVAKSMPVANQRRQQQLKAANDLQVQQAVQKASTAAPVQQSAQNVGAAVQQNTGQQMIQQAQAGLQQNQQIAGAGIQQQTQQLRSTLEGLRGGLETQKMADVERLAALSADAKREVLDSRMNFERDEMGRTFLNERQLADYLRLNARSDEQVRNYAQAAQMVHDRKIEMLQTAARQVEARMKYEAAQNAQFLDSEAAKEMLAYEAELKRLAAEEAAILQKKQEEAGMAGGIIGAVIGGYAGGPKGATAGYSAGQGVGRTAAS